ncbi:MAG: PIG-L family deacetylase [Ardenticatenia bacterium]|nr:PIG-L family deacetylase [Ardenticatenia bacterium]
MEHIFLAPHLDDVVLSCGGQIWQLTQRGHRPWVITVFAGSPAPGAAEFSFARHQHRLWGEPPLPAELRRAEDVAACVRLGVPPERVIHLDFPDAVYRHTPDGQPLYTSDEAIFGPPHPADGGNWATAWPRHWHPTWAHGHPSWPRPAWVTTWTT